MSDFKLPEYWCVKVTIDNANILGEFYGKHVHVDYKTSIINKSINEYITSHNISSGRSLYEINNGANYFIKNPDNKFKEITFEQFKKYVLKEEEFKVGDWVTFDSVKDNCKYTSKIKDWECGSYCILENGTEPFKSIIRKATQEEVDAVTKIEYTIEDLSNGKCAVINDGTVEELRLVLKAAFPKCNIHTNGMNKYYYRHNTIHWSSEDYITTESQSVKTFLKQLNNNKQMEILGYKLIKPEYESAVAQICHKDNTMSSRFQQDKTLYVEGSVLENIKKAGVLDLWFEPIYKPEVKIFTMQCDGGTFELEVSNKGIYYFLEDSWLYIEDVASLLPKHYINKMRYINSKSVSTQSYNIKANTKIDVGCKKNTLISEWEQVYNYYKSLV